MGGGKTLKGMYKNVKGRLQHKGAAATGIFSVLEPEASLKGRKEKGKKRGERRERERKEGEKERKGRRVRFCN